MRPIPEDLEPWEPEESVGKLWHAFASRLDAPADHANAAVRLDEVAGRLAVLFRGLGGARSVEIRPAAVAASPHRLSLRRRLGTPEERLARPAFDGAALRLPPALAPFPDRAANAALYLWLAAAAAHAPAPPTESDPLRADLAALRAAQTMTAAALAAAPGLRALHAGLAHAALAQRRAPGLPRHEAAVEAVVRHLLGGPAPAGTAAAMLAAIQTGDLSAFAAPRGYRLFQPVPLWPALEAGAPGEAATDDGAAAGGSGEGAEGAHRARRRRTDQVQRRDSLILFKFEAILSWADFLNLNRRVDDDDPDSARKAADDLDEISLGQVSKSPATRLKLHLDLAPADVDRERLAGQHLYPEWDHKAGAWLPDHCRVLATEAAPAPVPAPDPAAARRIRAVRRRFDALRPRRVILPQQPDGDDLDLDAAVRARLDLIASGRGSDRVWRASRSDARDLAVSILLDASRSTESAVTGRPVIDIAREALTALAWGIHACGDDCAIHAFSSLRRDRVYVEHCKDFDEPMGAAVEARIAGLRPGFYTRLGAAVRHVSAGLAARARQRRLLLIITDGKPNDLDHYEGQHGIEDSRMAIREARRAGQAAYGIAIEAGAKSWFPRLFGRGGFTVIPHPDRLTEALPGIYRQLVGT
jgi:nitric oxide reductase NorD protein